MDEKLIEWISNIGKDHGIIYEDSILQVTVI